MANRKVKAFVKAIKNSSGLVLAFGVYVSDTGSIKHRIDIPTNRKLWTAAYRVACNFRDRMNELG